MTTEQKQKLLKIARNSLENHFDNVKEQPVTNNSEKAATFVTLTKNGQLRGCVGTLLAFETLELSIIHNVLAAAFNDDRFPPLTKSELSTIKIEISILFPQQQINYADSEDLLNKIIFGQDGISIKYRNQSSTFLPQVWDQISDKKEFLNALCEKAGLPENFWQSRKLIVHKYKVEKISE